LVEGSPLQVLSVEPHFEEYHFIDLDPRKTARLRELAGEQPNVYVYEDDCNTVLLEKIIPLCRYGDYRRALWVLDPYGMHYRWDIVVAAGRAKTVDLLLNFPTMGINRDALWRDTKRVTAESRARMDAFWGDDSWVEIAYTGQDDLFGESSLRKLPTRGVVKGYCDRLKSEAGFAHVAAPLPMRNSQGAVVYYLLFASQNRTAVKVANDIFRKYGATGIGPESSIEA
jgi:three-Cys-motif partner protein